MKVLLKTIGMFPLIMASTGLNAQTVNLDCSPLARGQRVIETIADGEAFDYGSRSIGMPERNVLGEELATCSTDPRTGFDRDGCCGTYPNDRGRHELCAVMTGEFLSFSKEQGNDLVTPRPELEFPGLDPGDRWCLCLGRWIEALEATRAERLPETTVPPVVLEATNEAVLDSVELETLESHSYDA